MMQERLRQIDRDLIKLLGERIAVLAESDPPFLGEQLSDLTSLLAQFGVPELVGKSFVSDCAAEDAIASPPPAKIKPRRVTVIGGNGMMGRFFTQRLSAAGHDVYILEHNDWERAETLLAEAELVLVCVSIESTLKAIRHAAQYLAPTTALADITSIKAPIVQAMLECHKGPVMGLHPMFGPSVQSFSSQNVLVCSGRGDEAFQWLLELIASEGGQLIACMPEEHDQMMAIIQAVRQFSTLSLGVFLAQEGIDIRRSLDFSSPSYRQAIGMIGHLFAQSAPLIVDIMLANLQSREAIVRLANTYNRLVQLVMHQEREALIDEFKVAAAIWEKSLPLF